MRSTDQHMKMNLRLLYLDTQTRTGGNTPRFTNQNKKASIPFDRRRFAWKSDSRLNYRDVNRTRIALKLKLWSIVIARAVPPHTYMYIVYIQPTSTPKPRTEALVLSMKHNAKSRRYETRTGAFYSQVNWKYLQN